jgi:hypothetical protein
MAGVDSSGTHAGQAKIPSVWRNLGLPEREVSSMKALYLLTLATAVHFAPVQAACSYPTEPTEIPDGKTATLEQMKTAQQAVKAFDEAIVAYTSCLKLEHEAAMAKSPDMSDDQKKEMEKKLAQKHDAAITADEALAARFNEQVKAYKAAKDAGTSK